MNTVNKPKRNNILLILKYFILLSVVIKIITTVLYFVTMGSDLAAPFTAFSFLFVPAAFYDDVFADKYGLAALIVLLIDCIFYLFAVPLVLFKKKVLALFGVCAYIFTCAADIVSATVSIVSLFLPFKLVTIVFNLILIGLAVTYIIKSLKTHP